MVKISKHAEMRLKERCGLNKKSMKRVVEKAFNDGVQHKETKGNLCKWITSLYLKHKTANNIRLYGDKAYIFVGDVLVTVIQIPSNLRNDMSSFTK